MNNQAAIGSTLTKNNKGENEDDVLMIVNSDKKKLTVENTDNHMCSHT